MEFHEELATGFPPMIGRQSNILVEDRTRLMNINYDTPDQYDSAGFGFEES
jgi:hypothetical protein